MLLFRRKHLQYLHVNEYIVKWMKSYLLGREQLLEYTSLRVLSGVPQGSVLGPGPLLFISYINQVTEVISQNNIIMFADDMALYRVIKPNND